MTYTCPECHTAFDGGDLGGLALVHCPSCGRGFEPHATDGGPAAAWAGRTRTSRLAIFALVAGILSLVSPLCLCFPLFFFAFSAGGGPGPVVVGPGPGGAQPVPAQPMVQVTVTLPDGSTQVRWVPAPPAKTPFEEEIIEEDEGEEGGEGEGRDEGSGDEPGDPGSGGG